MRALFNAAARRWWHRILPRVPGCLHGRTGPQAGPAVAAGIYRAARWGGEAGLRAQCRETLAHPARRRRCSPSGLSISAMICLPASRSLPPFTMPAATSSSHASQLRIRRLLNICGAELQEHRQTVCKRGKRTTTIYRWLSAVPLRATDDAIIVNWFSIETFNAKGKRTYYNSFVTDLAITARHCRRTRRLRARPLEDR